MNLDLWQMVGIYHVLPSILRISLLFGIIYLAIKVFKIKNPGTKALLYCLPLIKGYFGLLLGTGYFYESWDKGYFSLGLLRTGISMVLVDHKNDVFFWAVIIGICLVCAINTIRWICIYFFYRSLAYETEVTRKEAPEIFKVLDKLVPLFNVKYPKVILCHKKYATPVMLGVRNPKIIFSPNLIEYLNEKDLSLIIAHELAHLKRHDYILHWISFTLRDCLFFNPLVHVIYKKISNEMEKAADLLAINKLSLKAEDLIMTLSKVNNFMINKKTKLLPLGATGISGSIKDLGDKSLYERIVFLMENYDIKTSLATKIAFTVVCFAVFAVNFNLALPLAQRIIVFY